MHGHFAALEADPDAAAAVARHRQAGAVEDLAVLLEPRQHLAVPGHHALERAAQPEHAARVGGDAENAAARLERRHDRLGHVAAVHHPPDALRGSHPQRTAAVVVHRRRLGHVVDGPAPLVEPVQAVARRRPHAAVGADGGGADAIVREPLERGGWCRTMLPTAARDRRACPPRRCRRDPRTASAASPRAGARRRSARSTACLGPCRAAASGRRRTPQSTRARAGRRAGASRSPAGAPIASARGARPSESRRITSLESVTQMAPDESSARLCTLLFRSTSSNVFDVRR